MFSLHKVEIRDANNRLFEYDCYLAQFSKEADPRPDCDETLHLFVTILISSNVMPYWCFTLSVIKITDTGREYHISREEVEGVCESFGLTMDKAENIVEPNDLSMSYSMRYPYKMVRLLSVNGDATIANEVAKQYKRWLLVHRVFAALRLLLLLSFGSFLYFMVSK